MRPQVGPSEMNSDRDPRDSVKESLFWREVSKESADRERGWGVKSLGDYGLFGSEPHRK